MSAATDACHRLRAERDQAREDRNEWQRAFRRTEALYAELEAENRRLRTRLANVERDRRQLAAMRNAGDVVRVPLVGRAT